MKEAIRKIEATVGAISCERIPMIAGDHPEQDRSEVLNPSDKEIYQMLIGKALWTINLGRFDILFAVSSLDRYSNCPRTGHFMRILKVFGYLKKYPSRSFCVNPKIQNYSKFDKYEYSWLEQYPDAIEEIPSEAPEPLGKEIVITCHVDSDHAHDTESRWSITGYIVVINSMPLIWYSKRQGSVESSTYGAEFVAMRMAIECLKGVRYWHRMLGVPMNLPCFVFGDNLAVVNNATDPASTLKKKHLGICYHLVRETVAAHVIDIYHVSSEDNPANPLTKSETQANLKIIEEVFFYSGD
ncbi:MAG: Ty1/Copia family ribonuclease HI [Gloeomargaritales cyanobacterium]